MRRLRRLLLATFFLAAIAAGWLGWFATRPLELAAPLDFTVRQGAGVSSVARQLTDAGLLVEPWSLRALARVLGREGAARAGTYRLERALTPLEPLDKRALRRGYGPAAMARAARPGAASAPDAGRARRRRGARAPGSGRAERRRLALSRHLSFRPRHRRHRDPQARPRGDEAPAGRRLARA